MNEPIGAGESGKSTIAKQMKIIHLDGFPEAERMSYKSIIYNNVVVSMKALTTACRDLDIAVSPANRVSFIRIHTLPSFAVPSFLLSVNSK